MDDFVLWLLGQVELVSYRCKYSSPSFFVGRRLPTIPGCWRLSWRGWGWNLEFKVFKHVLLAGWYPIDTAPKDGTPILLAGGTWGDDFRDAAKCVMVGWWEVGYKFPMWNTCAAEAGCSMFPYSNPTHWMPVPAAPDIAR